LHNETNGAFFSMNSGLTNYESDKQPTVPWWVTSAESKDSMAHWLYGWTWNQWIACQVRVLTLSWSLLFTWARNKCHKQTKINLYEPNKLSICSSRM